MRHIFIGFLFLVAVAHGQCVQDYTIHADSTPVQVAFLQGLVDRWCFEDPCDSSLRYGEITVRVKSDSFSNSLVFYGFQGNIGLSVMDTNCSLQVLSVCLVDMAPTDTAVFTYTLGRNFIAGITSHMQQLPWATVGAAKVPAAQPPPIINTCPVSIPEKIVRDPRYQHRPLAIQINGETVILTRDHRRRAWVWSSH